MDISPNLQKEITKTYGSSFAMTAQATPYEEVACHYCHTVVPCSHKLCPLCRRTVTKDLSGAGSLNVPRAAKQPKQIATSIVGKKCVVHINRGPGEFEHIIGKVEQDCGSFVLVSAMQPYPICEYFPVNSQRTRVSL